ncbi:LPS assembly lipoprotein LptE [Thalassotalea maritima]|uniref:LPS-assembly lipoprotein LptE n=1 Tax=Thalassotalea maritima TaxID=3242416 RepID=UPI00352831F4
MLLTTHFTKHLKLTISAMLMVSLLTACGFKLRGDYLIPERLQTMYVSSQDPHGELTRVVKQHLTVNDITIIKSVTDDVPHLRILKDSLNRRTLSLFENGQVAEYELTYTVRYEVMINEQERQYYDFNITRSYQDDPNRALAKTRELNLLRKEMRVAAADKILRDLASIKLNG